MCGIVGYVSKNENAKDVIYESLKRLEYRGYDSSGLGLINEDKFIIKKAVGKIANLEPLLDNIDKCSIGIGHTRWATHGNVSIKNAHPHISQNILVVHNGIIENYKELKEELVNRGIEFTSDTDTEVIVHLLSFENGSLFDRVKKINKKLKGLYAFVALNIKGEIVGVRKGAPLILGIGENFNIVASDLNVIIPYTDKVIFLNDGEIFNLNSLEIVDENFNKIEKSLQKIDENFKVTYTKGNYQYYMLKEIEEQPEVIRKILSSYLDLRVFENLSISDQFLKNIKNIKIIACGSSYYSGLIFKYFLNNLLDIDVDVVIASEAKYSTIFSENSLVISISQSGETTDTLAALRYAKEKKSKILSFVNVWGSSIARESHDVIYTHAGPEKGVASTKSLMAQILTLYLFGCYLIKINDKDYKKILEELKTIPSKVEQLLKINLESALNILDEALGAIYIGRGISYPIAMEGALKLKELSYIYAQGYAAGELKHGTIALIDKNTPTIAIVPKDETYDKTLSNIQEIKARDGKVIAISSEENLKVDVLIKIPEVNEPKLYPLLNLVVVQLLSYHSSKNRGNDVDMPRNLAKSVTVE